MSEELTRYFESVFEAFQNAAGTVGTMVRGYTIGDTQVRLHFAGHTLIPLLTRSLDHLDERKSLFHEHATSVRHLTVLLFDSTSTGFPLKDFPFQKQISQNQSQRWYFENESINAFFQQGANSLQVLDKKRNVALFWVPEAGVLPIDESASPLKIILHWWFGMQGTQMIHTAAVGTDAGAVLIAGKTASGKSTAALTCLESGMDYLADDYCLVSLNPQPRVHSLYNGVKLNEDNIENFPGLTPVFRNRHWLDSNQELFYLYPGYQQQLVEQRDLRAILLPKVTHQRETKVKEISASEALLAIAPNTLLQLPGARDKSFQFAKELVGKVPVFTLELGTDFGQIPHAIASKLCETVEV